MKKFLKVLAAAAALAAVVPYKAKADENGGEAEGLLWKASWKLDPDYQSEPDINITFGLNNPFENLNKESHLFADDLVVDYCCDDTLAHSNVHEACTCEEEAEPAPAEDSCGCADETVSDCADEAATDCTCSDCGSKE